MALNIIIANKNQVSMHWKIVVLMKSNLNNTENTNEIKIFALKNNRNQISIALKILMLIMCHFFE